MAGFPKIDRVSLLFGLNKLGFWGFLFWSVALPWAQVQEHRFTSIALFIILGSWLLKQFVSMDFKGFSSPFKPVFIVFFFFAILPLLDFWRWQFPVESLREFQIRLPFLVMPFLVWNFQPFWPENWWKLAFGLFGLSLGLTVLFSLAQGPGQIWNLIHSDHSTDLVLIMQRPFYGLILGAFIISFPAIFPKHRFVFLFLILATLAFLILILTKVALISLLFVCLLSGIFKLFQRVHSPIQTLIFWIGIGICLAFGINYFIQSPYYQDIISTGEIQYQNLGKTYSNSFNTRLIIWKAAFEVLQTDRNWMFGLGTCNFQPALDVIYQRENEFVFAQHFNPHNLFLYLGLQYGLLGFCVPILGFWFLVHRQGFPFQPRSFLVLAFIFMCAQSEIFINRELGVHFIIWIALILTFNDLNEKSTS